MWDADEKQKDCHSSFADEEKSVKQFIESCHLAVLGEERSCRETQYLTFLRTQCMLQTTDRHHTKYHPYGCVWFKKTRCFNRARGKRGYPILPFNANSYGHTFKCTYTPTAVSKVGLQCFIVIIVGCPAGRRLTNFLFSGVLH